MYTRPKVPVLTKYAVAVLATLTVSTGVLAQETFSLPVNTSKLQVPNAKLTFNSNRFKFSASKESFRTRKIEAQSYFFEKQTFLTAKRDQAIKLLRQELASGYRKNRDNVLLRLGQLYTEKYMELNYHEVELYNKQLEAYEQTKKGRRPKLSSKRSRRYLVKALDTLTKLERQYPKHHRMDEVLFFIGFVNMEFGRTTKGAKYLERLIRQYPKSHKYQEGMLYLADHYFEKQKFNLAIHKYRTLLKYRDSELYDYALYKLAWCQLNLDQKDKALRNMKQVISRLDGEKQNLKFNIREQALNDIALFFAENGKADEAYDYYVKHLGKDVAVKKLKAIAQSMHSKGKNRESLKAFEKLLDMDEDAIEAPSYAMAIYEAKSRLGQDKEAVKSLVETTKRYGATSDWAKKHEKDNKEVQKSTLTELEKDVTNAAYYYHRTAQKTKKKHYYDYALELYQALESNFPEHKEKRKLVFYQGEILYNKQQWVPASEKYMIIARGEPKDKLAEEAAYNALLSVDKLTTNAKVTRFTEKEKKEGKFSKKSIPKGEQKFIEVSEFYLANYSSFKRATDVRFRIAGIYYRYHHFDKAAPIFKEIAEKNSRHKHATTSAHLLLDIYNINKNYAALSEQASLFAKNKKLGNRKFKNDMALLRDEVNFKAIETHESKKEWAPAGAAYLKYYKANPKSRLAEQALYNSVVSYEKAKDEPKLAEVSTLFVKKYPKHKYSKRLTLLGAKNAEKSFNYEAALAGYELYVRRYPKDRESRKALYNAAIFADVLEQNQKALNLYREYSKKRISHRERRAIDTSRANVYLRMGNWRRAVSIHNKLLETSPTLNSRIATLGILADIYESKKRRGERIVTLEKIRKSTARLSSAKQFGSDSRFVAESRLPPLKKDRRAYERIRLRFPPARLVSGLKQKQKSLERLDKKYEKIVKLGNPQWGVAVLEKRASAYQHFIDTYKGVKIPRRYKGEERKELEKQMKVLEEQFIQPFEKKVTDIYQLCHSKAVEFFVASKEADGCYKKLVAKNKAVAPGGSVPKARYWTTQWANMGVAAK